MGKINNNPLYKRQCKESQISAIREALKHCTPVSYQVITKICSKIGCHPQDLLSDG